MTQERLAVILEEPVFEAKDWSAEIVPNATIADLDELAVAKARIMFKRYILPIFLLRKLMHGRWKIFFPIVE